jgi:hypothetical protein
MDMDRFGYGYGLGKPLYKTGTDRVMNLPDLYPIRAEPCVYYKWQECVVVARMIPVATVMTVHVTPRLFSHLTDIYGCALGSNNPAVQMHHVISRIQAQPLSHHQRAISRYKIAATFKSKMYVFSQASRNMSKIEGL